MYLSHRISKSGPFGWGLWEGLLLADSSPRNLKGAVRETLAGQWPERLLPTGWQRPRYLREKMLSTEPVFGTRVDPVQKEVFLGLVPTLVVTSRWHSRKLGLPRAQVSHRKVLSGVSEWPSVHAHGVRRSIPAHSCLSTGWAGASGLGWGTSSMPSRCAVDAYCGAKYQICAELCQTDLPGDVKNLLSGAC